MARYYFETLGCKVNQAETVALERGIRGSGHQAVRDPRQADVIVVNSCTVTGNADADARQLVRRLRRFNEGARLILTGCLAERAGEERPAWPEVDEFVPNAAKARLVPEEPAAGREIDPAEGTLWDVPEAYPQFPGLRNTRSFLKVQDGCDARCSFCVIPRTRGRSRSLALARVLRSLEALAAQGAREVVLTGIHLGHYGRDQGGSLVELLERVEELGAPERVRLTSVEPNEVTPELVDRVARSPRLAPHFHVPLQSGSDRILARMRRPYRAAAYARVVEGIRRRMPRAGIGADVIVGFPGETQADFRATRSLVRSLPLSYLHVFRYSPRPDTDAASLDGPVGAGVALARSRELRELGEELAGRFVERLAGSEERALSLEAAAAGTRALTGNFIHVELPEALAPNRMYPVRLLGRRGGRNLAVRRARAVDGGAALRPEPVPACG